MNLVSAIEKSGDNRHHLSFRGLYVPFPEFDNDYEGPDHRHQAAQQLSQPSDSEAGDSSTYHNSSSSRTATITSASMESSTSSTTLSESLQGETSRDDVIRQPLFPAACLHRDEEADAMLPPSETSRCPLRRISCQDEMLSIDLSSVPDPVSCIKRILEGLVCELKEQADQSQQHEKEAGGLSSEKQGVAKRARMDHENQQGETSLDHDDPPDATGNSELESSSTADKQQQHSIQTIINWMDTFQDSEPVQLACLQSLPSLLEHNTLRYHAQMEGLATIVLYDMAAFQENFLLQLTAFHTLVVLLRPLGAMEGTLVRTRGINGKSVVNGVDKSKAPKGMRTTVNEDGECLSNRNVNHVSKNQINDTTSQHESVGNSSSTLPDSPLMSAPTSLPLWEENGVRVMLDVLRLYSHDRYLQAMGCWAMVNAALYPTLKKSLLKLGGVYVVTNAMMLHPSAEAVQFRGLFALINLVIPDADADATSIHCHVYQIARLTILAMKNFHTNKSILNRGCLVLRNLSLTRSHVTILARTPGCIDMLLHCRQACPKDLLVQRSARTIMILMQRVTDRKIMWSGTNTGTSSDVQTEGTGLGAASTTADAGSSASAPCVPRKEECGKRSRNSCSW